MYTSDLKPGINFTQIFTVSEIQTARYMGSGNLDVFATPSMIACMENTAMKLIQPYLDNGFDSVGTEINAKHTKASLPGEEISFTATIEEIDDRSIILSIKAQNEKGVCIGTASHARFIIDTEQFLKKIMIGSL